MTRCSLKLFPCTQEFQTLKDIAFVPILIWLSVIFRFHYRTRIILTLDLLLLQGIKLENTSQISYLWAHLKNVYYCWRRTLGLIKREYWRLDRKNDSISLLISKTDLSYKSLVYSIAWQKRYYWISCIQRLAIHSIVGIMLILILVNQ